ncbi:hypothetical protein [Sphingomonas aracearum]|nr:hypothetical protein [Sphingomonas aracearum]
MPDITPQTPDDQKGEVTPHADDVLPADATQAPPEEHEAEKTGDFA